MSAISLSAMTKIIKGTDPDIRVGAQAKHELRSCVEDYAMRISELALNTARNANRNTVLPQDIIAAREQLMIGVKFHQKQTSK
ncbi:MAG: NFYB/HAP3 family transcription factor subunit [Candidatus Thermoplasmatota archaeon]|nr:NFYB/HAP3 family transcription factor subunit [Candidatus Thermoplasmatota archaeon]